MMQIELQKKRRIRLYIIIGKIKYHMIYVEMDPRCAPRERGRIILSTCRIDRFCLRKYVNKLRMVPKIFFSLIQSINRSIVIRVVVVFHGFFAVTVGFGVNVGRHQLVKTFRHFADPTQFQLKSLVFHLRFKGGSGAERKM